MTETINENKTGMDISEKSGLDPDYFNEYAGFSMALDWAETNPKFEEKNIWEILAKTYENKGAIILRYEERYPRDKFDYENLEHPLNEENIKKLDGIAEEINKSYKDGNLTLEQLKKCSAEAQKLIYGEQQSPA